MQVVLDVNPALLISSFLLILFTVVLFYVFAKKKKRGDVILIVYDSKNKFLREAKDELEKHLKAKNNKIAKGGKRKRTIMTRHADSFDAKYFNYYRGEVIILFLLSCLKDEKKPLSEKIMKYLKKYPTRKFNNVEYSFFCYGLEPNGENKVKEKIEEVDKILKERCKTCLKDIFFSSHVGDYHRQFRAWKSGLVRVLYPPIKNHEKRKKKKTQHFQNQDIEELETHLLKGQLKKTLSKQNYAHVGSHSSVKLCRWVSNMLQGKGSCYKHTAYGIMSYCCIQSTTSIACANRCIFCWRHNNNPVTRDWRWDYDDPQYLADNFIETQKKLIKKYRGLPKTTKERFDDAMKPRHVALSLIGESMLYPKVNEFLDIMHKKGISSFLVTNGMYPDLFRKLAPCTQTYLSVSAPNKEKFKELTKPIFKDYWERYLESLKILSEKKERTVLRFTVIKDWNMEDLQGYIKLIKRGSPDFVELKGVTYCNTDDIKMENVPFHSEVREFAKKLYSLGLEKEYELAVEHSHTCFVLIAKKKFKINGKWNTWIDFEGFTKLVEEKKEIVALDYGTETPKWAVWGAEERGIDPKFCENLVRK